MPHCLRLSCFLTLPLTCCIPLLHSFLCCCIRQQDEQPYIIEANPRASRTVPFVAKAVGHPIAKYASLLMSGQTLQDIGFTEVCGAGRCE